MTIQAPVPNPGPTAPPPPTVSSPSHFIYGVIGFESDGLLGGVIDPTSGKVSPMTGSFLDGLQQGNVLQVLTDPAGRFVFTMREAASSFGVPIGHTGIASLQVNSQTGALTLAPNSPIINDTTGSGASLFLDGMGRFLYQPNTQKPQGIDVYQLNQTTGELTKMASSNVLPLGDASVGTLDGKFIFNAGTGKVQTLDVDASGQLSVVASVTAKGGGAGPIAVSADSKFLYSADSVKGTVSVFSVGADGSLIETAGSPFSTPPRAFSVALSPDGKFFYGLFGSGVEGFAVDPAAGTFMQIAGFTPISATAFTLDRDGKFAFVSDDNVSQTLITFAIDATTGAFTKMSTSPQPLTDEALDLTTVP